MQKAHDFHLKALLGREKGRGIVKRIFVGMSWSHPGRSEHF